MQCVNINELTKSDKSNPIMYAVQEGRLSMMKILLEKGASVENNEEQNNKIKFFWN